MSKKEDKETLIFSVDQTKIRYEKIKALEKLEKLLTENPENYEIMSKLANQYILSGKEKYLFLPSFLENYSNTLVN